MALIGVAVAMVIDVALLHGLAEHRAAALAAGVVRPENANQCFGRLPLMAMRPWN